METTPSETPSSPESTTPKSSSTPIGKALIFPVVFLSIAALVWILAVAAANTDWYHASTDVTIAGTSVTATSTYTLTYAKTTQCISGICGSSIASYTELDTQTNFNQVQAATRGLLITGILVETGLVFYLGTLLLSYFVVQVDDIIKRYNKLFFFVGLGLSALATTLFLLSWLSYLGLPRAIRKDADGDCAGGPCETFSGSKDGTSWGPGAGFGLMIVVSLFNIASTVLFFFRGRKMN